MAVKANPLNFKQNDAARFEAVDHVQPIKERLIVDSNQADRIRFTYKKLNKQGYPTLVIPYLVWVELLEGGPDAEKRRRALQKFPLLFGMEPPAIFDAMANLSEDEIRRFVPVYPKGSPVHRRIESTFLHPKLDQVMVAREVKEHGKQRRQQMRHQFPRLHEKHRQQAEAARARGEPLEDVTWSTIQGGQDDLFLKENARYRQWLIEEVITDANGNRRQIVAKSENAMFDAAWDNLMLRRFLRLQAVVNLGYARNVWADSRLNQLPKVDQDDVPDISLVLYARNGETILTADKRIAYRIRLADVEQNINVSTWDDWLKTQNHWGS